MDKYKDANYCTEGEWIVKEDDIKAQENGWSVRMIMKKLMMRV